MFPQKDIVLPSLWEAIAGPGPVRWDVRDEEGKFLQFTPEFDRLWRWKDELPERKLACVGIHLRGHSVAVALDLLPALYALTGRAGRPRDFRRLEDLSPLERDVAEFVLAEGPCSTADVRKLVAAGDRRRAESAIRTLHKRLVLTNAGAERKDRGWPAVIVDILPRRHGDILRRLPKPEEARREVTRTILYSAGELSVADLTGATGWRRKEAETALEELAGLGSASVGEQDGISLWRPAG